VSECVSACVRACVSVSFGLLVPQDHEVRAVPGCAGQAECGGGRGQCRLEPAARPCLCLCLSAACDSLLLVYIVLLLYCYRR
jgi:hypothetical protein